MRIIFLFVLILCSKSAFCQCNCIDNFDSLSNSVEKNYIAFQQKIDSIGDYIQFKESVRKQAFMQDGFKCYTLLKSYLTYFGDPHLNINLVGNKENQSALESFFKNWPRAKISKNEVMKYFQRNKLDNIEGIWEMKSLKTKVAIYRKSPGVRNFVAVIFESDSLLWDWGMVRMEIKKSNNLYSIVYYKKDHTPINSLAYIQENNLVIKGSGTWTKIYPNQVNSGNDKEGISFHTLGNDASVVTINSFWISRRNEIDSLFGKNDSIISNRKYLLIDLRNNPGGHIMSTFSILKYIYSNPILSDGLIVRSSPENISIYQKIRNTPGFSSDDKSTFDSIILKMRLHPKSIVQVTERDTMTFEKKMRNPIKVAILTNETTLSAAELFVLWAKQSAKVIIFGRQTGGALDYTEIGSARNLPCPLYTFLCPMGTTYHEFIPLIDNVGIKPDVILNVGNQDWIKVAYEYLRK
ncbi:peptidase S41-like protein [Chitinophaga niastensis]|uniref:Peptidase S41-like protein n=1 Tax=Chitinophaga niastensis TaxID=536980 RepID=A0A2P8H9G8_CHINA|nr:S41 family peptidase [Chitinophaga niastensis]PSL42830.1 peptidase S41-like protein [Chitinophaga niastensis]